MKDEEKETIPITYRELLKKVQAIEKKLNIEDIEMEEESLTNEEEIPIDDEDDEDFDADITEGSISIQKKPEIVIKPKAYLKLSKHALSYANRAIPQKEWVEIIGLLTGFIKNEDTPVEQLIVRDYWPVTEGDAVKVEIIDQQIFTEIVENMKGKQFIIGWAHSHPSYTPFLSDDDIRTHLRYQTFWDRSIALVIDPLMISENSYGFKIFRVAKDKQSYFAIDFEVEGLSTEAAYDSIQLIMNE